MEATPQMIRILIVEDRPCYCAGLHMLLQAVPDLAVVGEASDGGAAVELARQFQPDVVLLSLAVPALDGLGVLKDLSGFPLQSRVILMAAAIDELELVRALELGARGVFLTGAPSEILVKCIRCVQRGQYWVSHEHTKDLIGALARVRSLEPPHAQKRSFNLTPRELDVVRLVVGAFSNREIARELSLSEQTVKHHVHNILDKTGASNRLELALFAVHHRLVQSEDSVLPAIQPAVARKG